MDAVLKTFVEYFLVSNLLLLDKGVITLDLFACRPMPLLPVVSDLKRLFSILHIGPKTGELTEANVHWSHELCGFRDKGESGPNLLGQKK